MSISAEEEWEGELEAELKDFEIVPGDGKHSLGRNNEASEKEDWEQQMDDLLDEDGDLK